MKTSLCFVREFPMAAVVLALSLRGTVRGAGPPIPFSEIGAKASADYHGDALRVAATVDGARLQCGFQRLEGHATPEGLWLKSTAPGGGRFRLVAQEVGRGALECGTHVTHVPLSTEAGALQSASGLPQCKPLPRGGPRLGVSGEKALPMTGTVSLADKLVRFKRPGVTEEYSVSVDGVRQDFVITERPAGEGDLRLELALSGARAEGTPYGAKVILEGSGRALAYSRLRATDATGRELRARIEVAPSNSESSPPSAVVLRRTGKQKAEMSQSRLGSVRGSSAPEEHVAATRSGGSASALVVVVEDAAALYPVRIDPTFSDANWVSLNPGIPGADSDVYAIAVDGSGDVYVGGDFTVIGTVVANCVAKWNGSVWSALGAGMGGVDYREVIALAVRGTTLYAGGYFTTAGGVSATNIAAWDGSAWSALGTGINRYVYALAVSGTNLYAGGWFTTAGGMSATNIAAWNGNAWSALGAGMGNEEIGRAS